MIASEGEAGARSELRLLTCGSVDDGKSTLVGRLLLDSVGLPDDQIEALRASAAAVGSDEIDLAQLVDGLESEREQGITIDIAWRYFSTSRRAFVVADAPGHSQYTRNMVTGASNAELAILLVDVTKGVVEQTRRHLTIVSLLGIRSIVFAVNKMDLVDYDQQSFNKVVDDLKLVREAFPFDSVVSIPLSARRGDNVALRVLRR